MNKTEQLLNVAKKIQTWIKAHPRKATIVWDVIHEFDDAIATLEAELAEQKPVKSAEEILKQYSDLAHNIALDDYNNKVYCIEFNDAVKAVEEYHSQFKTDLREELIGCLEYSEIRNHLKIADYFVIEDIVDEYLKIKQ